MNSPAEMEQIREVQQKVAKRVVTVPWMTEEPVDPQRLQWLAQGTVSNASAAF